MLSRKSEINIRKNLQQLSDSWNFETFIFIKLSYYGHYLLTQMTIIRRIRLVVKIQLTVNSSAVWNTTEAVPTHDRIRVMSIGTPPPTIVFLFGQSARPHSSQKPSDVNRHVQTFCPYRLSAELDSGRYAAWHVYIGVYLLCQLAYNGRVWTCLKMFWLLTLFTCWKSSLCNLNQTWCTYIYKRCGTILFSSVKYKR